MSYNKELYEWYKKNGICPSCGSNPAAPNRVRCWDCLAKNADSQYGKQRNKKAKEKFKLYAVELRSERKKNGQCIWCGKKICSQSTCLCLDCFLKNKRRTAANRKNAIPRSERVAYGLCYRCGKPLDTNRSLCKKCAESVTQNLSNASREHLTKVWKHENNNIFLKEEATTDGKI